MSESVTGSAGAGTRRWQGFGLRPASGRPPGVPAPAADKTIAHWSV